MKKYNVILIYNEDLSKILMCKREKEPYIGKLNLVGGKIEDGEDSYDAAYRELYEETGIKTEDTILYNLINFEYPMANFEMQLFFGKLNKPKVLVEELNKLIWVDEDSDFYDINKYAGDGNIWHMVKHANYYKEKLL